jgi:serine/threonine-protein phosphatase 2A regulatory subunit B'
MNLVVPHLDLIIEMIEKNIFRPLPILKKQVGNGEIAIEDDDVPSNRNSLATS